MDENVRVDKWLWAVRIFKTRSQATDACRKGHVSVDDLPVKPSRIIHPGETVKVRKQQVTRSFKVLKLAEKRMSAKLVPDFLEDSTPPEELEIMEMQKNMRWITRERGTGRPTKKERRELDDFFDL
ncbi:MAG: RNA-binding S4 domain-containing protein [Prolixibacteraceae bacterium]|jgi:ribosome-associated heat shock protein Hsp15|nr:RNA-binding S4 domain-containing protein [Prolixibacteraceae bacterium]